MGLGVLLERLTCGNPALKRKQTEQGVQQTLNSGWGEREGSECVSARVGFEGKYLHVLSFAPSPELGSAGCCYQEQLVWGSERLSSSPGGVCGGRFGGSAEAEIPSRGADSRDVGLKRVEKKKKSVVLTFLLPPDQWITFS